MPSHSMPTVCFSCRRSFKRPRRVGDEGVGGECPACHGPSIALHPHFKAPRKGDLKGWAKVQYLVEHGFYFRPLVDAENQNAAIGYPESLQEAPDWVRRWQHLAQPAAV